MPDQSEMPSILLVGNDLSLLEGLAQSLSAQGHSTRVASSFGEARELTLTNRPLIAVIEREMATTAAGSGRRPAAVSNDGVVPVDGSDSLFAEAPGPAAYLRLTDADHSDYLISEGALVDDVVLAFLDLHLYGEEDAMDDVPEIVEEHGGATFEEKPAA